jgi:hypothetical protein
LPDIKIKPKGILPKTIKKTAAMPKAYVRQEMVRQHKAVLAKAKSSGVSSYTDEKSDSPTNEASDRVESSINSVEHKAGSHSIRNLKKVKQKAKDAFRNSNSTVKTAKAAKAGNKTARTAVKSSQTAAKTIQRTAKTTAKSIKHTAKTAIKVTKLSAKAIVAASKAVVVAVKGLVSLIAAGGWVAIVIIIVVALLGWLLSSPAIFLNLEPLDPTVTVEKVLMQLEENTQNKISDIIDEHGEEREVVIQYPDEDNDNPLSHLNTVLAVFAVRASVDLHQQEIMPEELWFDEYHAQLLRETYDQMVFVWYEIEVVDEDIQGTDDNVDQHEDDNSDSEADVKDPRERLTVHVDYKSVLEVAGVFGINAEQVCRLEDYINYK